MLVREICQRFRCLFFHFVSFLLFRNPNPRPPSFPGSQPAKRTLISQPLVEKECRAVLLHLSLPPDFPTKSLTSDSLIRCFRCASVLGAREKASRNPLMRAKKSAGRPRQGPTLW